MQTDYQKVTGRQWTNPIHNNQTRKDIHNLTTKSAWQHQLKELITQIKAKVNTKTGRRELKFRDFYQRVDKKSGEIKAPRGLD